MSENQALELPGQPTESLSPLTRIGQVVILPLFYIYLIGAMISVPYFNWCYARDHGFASWLFIGEIVPTFQAGIWPYYALSGSSKPDWSNGERDNLEHFYRSLDASQQAVQIVNAGQHDRPSNEELEAFVALHKIALNEARKVDLEVLAKAHPELPTQFRDKYVRYLEFINRFFTSNGSFYDQSTAQKMWNEWAEWNNANATHIHMPKRRSR